VIFFQLHCLSSTGSSEIVSALVLNMSSLKRHLSPKNAWLASASTIEEADLPRTVFSFAPHKKPTFSLKQVLVEMKKADSSVLFAIMGLTGSGDTLKTLRTIHKNPKIFSYGVSDQSPKEDGKNDVTVYKPDKAKGVIVKSATLNNLVPAPFREEYATGGAHKIHHKFVVVDFNDSDPVLFTGSSNLAEAGEQANGDNLIAIYDRNVVAANAIEAIRLVDHYAFRAAMSTAS
jgi:phosphatidylserine/phosphatidylglycerophosphate/cardiolipin synthase-like enzyme